MTLLLPVLLFPMLLATQSVAGPVDYSEALKRADANEASLESSDKATLVASQDAALHDAMGTCVDLAPGKLPAFTIVLQLDADGRSLNSWRNNDLPMVRCVQRELAKATYATHQRTDFFVSFVVTFTR